jgi:hypothetical protein
MEVAPDLNTKNAKNLQYIFDGCTNLKTIGLLDLGNCTVLYESFNECTNLVNIGGFKDFGKAFTATTEKNADYTVNIHYSNNITHESLMNVINNLYDLNITYNVANGGTLYKQRLYIGAKNKAKLTAEEIALATNKGWIVE